jgi:hypothetical protein
MAGEQRKEKKNIKKNIPGAQTTCFDTSFGLFFCLFLASLGGAGHRLGLDDGGGGLGARWQVKKRKEKRNLKKKIPGAQTTCFDTSFGLFFGLLLGDTLVLR